MHKGLQTRIGIVGGGQLGKMLIEAGLPLNLKCNILENDSHAPASYSANRQIVGSLKDADKIKELAEISDVLTYEIEHIHTAALKELEAAGKTVIPFPSVLEIIQDKGLQKDFYVQHGIPTAPYLLVENAADWKDALQKSGFKKFAAKLRKGGYDGKGVELCNTEDILSGKKNIPFEEACVLEEFVACEKEIAVIVARGINGSMQTFPVVEMVFDPEANLVDTLACPARISSETEAKARKIALQVAEAFRSPGLFAVEMFLDSEGNILVNETAPRPHNSGHHTIESCEVSQYEQLLRILCGFEPCESKVIQPAVMINLLGATNFSGPYTLDGLQEVLQIPGVYIHLYNKAESKPKRKMGHVTICAETVEQALSTAQLVKDKLIFLPQ